MNITSLTGIINQYDLMYKPSRRSVDNTPDGAQQCGPCLIVKHYHDARVGQLLHLVRFPLATTQQKNGSNTKYWKKKQKM